jgi:hypothetical protein
MADEPRGFLPLRFVDGGWRTPGGEPVAWYDVQADLFSAAEIEAAAQRVLSVYGASDVVVDAFDQFRKEMELGAPGQPSE